MSRSSSFLPWPSFEETSAQKHERRKSLLQAFIAALGVHGVFFVWLSYAVPKEASILKPKPILSVEIQHFMEPNPSVAANEPDKAQAIAYKSQQAAQMHRTEAPLAHLPSVEGEIADSQSIIEASLSSSLPPSIQWLPSEALPETKALLPESSDVSADNPSSSPSSSQQNLAFCSTSSLDEGIKVEKIEPKALERKPEDPLILRLSLNEDLLQTVEETPAVPVEASKAQRPEPRPRPRLGAKALQAPVLKTQTRVATLGVLAIDAKWSLFGAYQQQVLEAISMQWQILASHLKSVEKDKKSEVVIEFYLNPDGRVEQLKVLKTNASMPATLVCQDAIRSREPFGVWPEEMVKLFGKDKRVCIHFFYR